MKKIYALLAAVVVIAAVSVAVAVTANDSDSLLEMNVDALSQVEEGVGKTCYDNIMAAEGLQVRYCPICDFVPGDKNLFATKKSCN